MSIRKLTVFAAIAALAVASGLAFAVARTALPAQLGHVVADNTPLAVAIGILLLMILCAVISLTYAFVPTTGWAARSSTVPPTVSRNVTGDPRRADRRTACSSVTMRVAVPEQSAGVMVGLWHRAGVAHFRYGRRAKGKT